MRERPEFLEYKSDPSYWNGHFNYDSCALDPPHRVYPKLSLRDFIPMPGRVYSDVELAYRQVSDFLDNGQHIGQKSFGDNDQFDARDFRDGTIIRFEQEELNTGLVRFLFGQYESKTFYGVVANLATDKGESRVLVCFRSPVGLEPPTVIKTDDIRTPQLDVGKVVHLKYTLYRIKNVEVLKNGDVVRVNSEKNVGVTLVPAFVPSL